MSIHVAPELLGRVFFVPKSIVDEHLAYVNGQQLKVLLYVLRHTGEDLEVQDLAGGLAMSAADVSDALQYWLTTGVLQRDDVPGGGQPGGDLGGGNEAADGQSHGSCQRSQPENADLLAPEHDGGLGKDQGDQGGAGDEKYDENRNGRGHRAPRIL